MTKNERREAIVKLLCSKGPTQITDMTERLSHLISKKGVERAVKDLKDQNILIIDEFERLAINPAIIKLN